MVALGYWTPLFQLSFLKEKTKKTHVSVSWVTKPRKDSFGKQGKAILEQELPSTVTQYG